MHLPLVAAPGRDPQRMLERVRAEWGGRSDLWVFGYASLIWNPAFEALEQRVAGVHGWHRALEMFSRINRGTPERPGLVCALVSGGSCRGVVFRIARGAAESALAALWEREMITGVYDPRWLRCHSADGEVRALAFTLSRRSPNHTGALTDAQLVEILRHARGKYGTTLAYLHDTSTSLRRFGIRDHGIERLVALARRHGL
jgi:cation transport protein ChaC